METRHLGISARLSELPGQNDDPVRPRRLRDPASRTRSLLLVALCDEDSPGDPKLKQDPRPGAVRPSKDPEHDMFRTDVVVVGRSRLGLGTGEHLSRINAETP